MSHGCLGARSFLPSIVEMGKSTISKSGRTSTFDKSRGRSGSFHSSLPLPDRGSTPQHVHPSSKLSARLIYGYMVCGLNRDPAQWSAVVPPVNGKVQRIPGNVGPFFKPHILGSIPPMESNEEIAQVFVSALQVSCIYASGIMAHKFLAGGISERCRDMYWPGSA